MSSPTPQTGGRVPGNQELASLALREITAAEKSHIATQNSSNNMIMWKRFGRLFDSEKKASAEVIDYLESDKKNMFHLYLETLTVGATPQDFMTLVMTRVQSREQISKKKLRLRKKRWIREHVYGGDAKKTDVVCKELESKNFKMKDKYFPDDDDEAYYLIEEEQSFTQLDKTAETMTGTVSGSLNKQEASALFDKGGPMGQVMVPKIAGLTEEANVNLVAELEKAASGAVISRSEAAKKRRQAADEAKKLEDEKKKKEEEEAKKAAVAANPKLAEQERKTQLIAEIDELMQNCVDHTTRAQAHVMVLQNHEVSDKLMLQFNSHHTLMRSVCLWVVESIDCSELRRSSVVKG